MSRAAALALALAATTAIYLLVVRDEDPGEGDEASAPTAAAPAAVRGLVADLSTEQKVDGVLMLGFAGTDGGAPFLDELRVRELGGVLVRRENWLDADQGTALVSELHAAAEAGGSLPPLVAAAQEGGPYRALADLPPEDRQLDIGDESSEQLAQHWALETGLALREAGLDMNLSPVADVATIASPIADRAFSDDPGVAARMTAAAVRGCEEALIACVARHFPGLGAASQSTDGGPATVGLDEATLLSRDVAPFQAAIEAGAPAVMLSHAYYAAYDAVTPASLAPAIATDLLRERLGFSGIAITDDLGAGAITATYDVPEAAVAAINAGADLLLIGAPADQRGVRDALIQAVEDGDISPGRIDEAVGRVLELKLELGLIEAP